ncbi:major capsid protein [Peribacillus simplex]|uniref:Major capsid protein n=2 Tax=Peribacillus TaxID=2675229 RepID=A0AA90PH11_9BACI|nr:MULTISPECIES: major capsid protein [Peribacillus]MDP1419237.1 major capsid protein [Peribacillus simplex]MDP1452125.1 major capsid protein [Peribacillus frigoritolerans]
MSTKISDIIVPEVFNPYVINRTAELSALVQSGIVVPNNELDSLASSGGKTINMPFFNDLTGDDEVLSDDGALTPQKISTGQDVAVLLMRGKAWGVNDLAKALSGADPMKAIGDLVATYWARQRQKTLFAVLKGAFESASMAGNVHDVSAVVGQEVISATGFIDAQYKLGDAAGLLTAVAMHSATYAKLQKDQLITYKQDPVSGVSFPVYLDKRVIVDDGCPVTNGVYTTYLFGQGAVGEGNGSAPVPTETDRDSLKGEDILINRQHFILHPRGIAFQSASVAGSSPTNAELGNAVNWNKVYDNKNIRIVKYVHKLA